MCEHGATSYLGGATCFITDRWRAVHTYLLNAGHVQRVRAYVKEVQWKLIVKLPQNLFRAYTTRIADGQERAAFNFILHPDEHVESQMKI